MDSERRFTWASGVFARFFAGIKQLCWRLAYEFLARLNRESDWTFMNYGFVNLDPRSAPLPLEPSDEKDRFCIQLYHRVVGAVDLKGLDVLEIGCGRGGGSSYIMRYLRPRSLTGVDISEKAIDLCRQYHTDPGLVFFPGNAGSLPFSAQAFDAVVNIESSHCYASMERFLAEVYRVLRPDGFFLFADLRERDQAERLRGQLQSSGLLLLKAETITPGVLAALDRDSERKRRLIQQKVPWAIRRWFRGFAAIEGTRNLEAFREGRVEYQTFVLRKNSAGATVRTVPQRSLPDSTDP